MAEAGAFASQRRTIDSEAVYDRGGSVHFAEADD